MAGTEHRSNTGLKPPWKPGECPNPNGRPKGTGLTDKLRKVIEEKDPDDPTKTVAERLIETVRREAVRGNWKFVEMIFDRLDGPVLRAAIGTVNVDNRTVIIEGSEWNRRLQSGSGSTAALPSSSPAQPPQP